MSGADLIPSPNPDHPIKEGGQTIDFRENYKTIFEQALDGIFIADKNGRYTDVNPAGCEMVGYTREEITRLTISDLVTEDEVSRIAPAIETLLRDGKIVSNWKFRRKDQSVFLGEVTVKMLSDGHLQAFLRDITELRLTEDALRESEGKFRKIYEDGPFGMALVNDELRFISANPAFCQMVGYTEQELQEITFKEITHADDIQNDLIHITKLIAGEIPMFKTEKRYVRKDGEVIWGSLTVSANYGIDGQFLYNLAIIENITERKKVENEIIKLNYELEDKVKERTSQLIEANKELEAFSYSVSHDLRAPLRVINGFIQILMDEYATKLDEEGKRLCTVVQENSQKMGQLIGELLVFSRLKTVEMKQSLISFNPLINAIFLELTDDRERQRIDLNIGDICDAHGDPNMLRQVWVNLLSNAIKFTSNKQKALISVTCRNENGKCMYCIRDNGVGFDMAYVNKLFKVFERLHSTNDFEGTGVGLAIVQRIIQRHGGEVWAEGEVNQGASFYFSLPFVEAGL